MQHNSILDRDHLARYTLGDRALELEVLELFIGQIPQSLASLKSSSEPTHWRRAAHTIKGSARVVGAWHLAEAAEQAEAVADCPEQWSRVADFVEDAAHEVRERIVELHDAQRVDAQRERVAASAV